MSQYLNMFSSGTVYNVMLKVAQHTVHFGGWEDDHCGGLEKKLRKKRVERVLRSASDYFVSERIGSTGKVRLWFRQLTEIVEFFKIFEIGREKKFVKFFEVLFGGQCCPKEQCCVFSESDRVIHWSWFRFSFHVWNTIEGDLITPGVQLKSNIWVRKIIPS